MRRTAVLLCLFTTLLSLKNLAQAEALVPSDGEKMAFIKENFQSVRDQSYYWQYGWIALFGGSAVLNGAVWGISDSDKEVYDAKVGFVTSALGVGDLLTNPMRSHEYADQLEAGQVDLAQAEVWLKAAAEREEYERSWLNHLLAGVVNGIAGLAVAYDDKRPGDGWLVFATNTLATEVKIFTAPQQMSKAWKAYQSGDKAALTTATAAAKTADYRWQLAASGSVLTLNYRF
jgi:hypothetical protein